MHDEWFINWIINLFIYEFRWKLDEMIIYSDIPATSNSQLTAQRETLNIKWVHADSAACID